MKPLSRPLQVLLLGSTALSLVAHGGDDSICGLHDGYSDGFDVVGQCGEPGSIVLSEKKGTCDLSLRGDDVGLPEKGRSTRGGTLEGHVTWTDATLSCSLSTHGEARERREVRCYADGEQVCRSYLIPEEEECDVTSCTVPICEDGQRLDLEEGSCCPVCVECETCVTPDPEPSCDPEACEPLNCGENFEISEGSCCDRCVPIVVEALCEEGRAAHRIDWEETKADWLACEVNEDCNLINTGTQCGRECGFLFSGRALAESYTDVMTLSNERCQHCPPVMDECPEPQGEPRCIDGLCQL